MSLGKTPHPHCREWMWVNVWWGMFSMRAIWEPGRAWFSSFSLSQFFLMPLTSCFDMNSCCFFNIRVLHRSTSQWLDEDFVASSRKQNKKDYRQQPHVNSVSNNHSIGNRRGASNWTDEIAAEQPLPPPLKCGVIQKITWADYYAIQLCFIIWA